MARALDGKVGLIVGVANKRSIAWAIAQAAAADGATLVLTYQDRFAEVYGFRGHDVELTLGAYGLGRAGPVVLEWDASASRRKNRNFIGLDGVSWNFVRESNLSLSVSASRAARR